MRALIFTYTNRVICGFRKTAAAFGADTYIVVANDGSSCRMRLTYVSQLMTLATTILIVDDNFFIFFDEFLYILRTLYISIDSIMLVMERLARR